MWTRKSFAVGEMFAFAESFRASFAELGEPSGVAAFAQPSANGTVDQIIASPDSEALVEALSPGGWAPCTQPSGPGLRLVGGRSDALLWFRLLI